MMDKLNFSFNWNNKLACSFFTTIRLKNPKYHVGAKFSACLKDKALKEVEVVAVKHLKLTEINDYIAGLDTGYDAVECRQLIKNMYKNKVADWNNQELAFVLLKTIKP